DSGYALDGAATVDWRMGKPKFAETNLDLSLLAGVPHHLWFSRVRVLISPLLLNRQSTVRNPLACNDL
ncbi:MAG: hypothetical protein WBE70_07680, partial [Candidatus Acidiferrum sp.]